MNQTAERPKQRRAFRNKYLAALVATMAFFLTGYGQVETRYSQISGTGFKYKRVVKDSVDIIPLSTSPHTPYRAGGIRYHVADSCVQVWTGTQWIKDNRAVQLTDTSFIIGNDTIRITGTSGGGGSPYTGPFNAPATGDTLVNSDKELKRLLKGYGIERTITGTNIKDDVDTTGATSLVPQERLRDTAAAIRAANPNEWVSVMDFGAKPNDLANDYTSNIKAAIASGARTILIPAGEYKITDSIRINSNQTILAYGAKFIRSADIDVILINNADGVTGGYGANSNISILGLAIDGNASVYLNACTLIAFGHATGITIRDCDLYNTPTWHLIEINGCKNTLIENTQVHDAVLVGRELIQIDLMSVSGAFPWFGPFDTTAVDGLTVRSCVFKNSNNGIGEHSVRDLKPHKNITIEDCWFENLSETAIVPYNFQNTIIRNNTIINCLHGVRDFTIYKNPYGLNSHYLIEGNTIKHLNRTPTEGRAINLRYATHVTIVNNQIDSINRHAIGLDWCDTFVVANNIIRDFGMGATNRFGIAVWDSRNGSITNNLMSTLDSRDAIVFRDAIEESWAPKNVTVIGNIIKTPFIPYTSGNIFSTSYPIEGTNIYIGSNVVNDTLIPYTKSVSANYTAIGNEGVILANTTSGNVTVTLKPGIVNEGVSIIKTAGTNTLTVNTTSGTINGASSITVDSSARLKSDGVNFYAMFGGGSGGGASVSDDAYDATTWNGVTGIAPSKNAIRDKLEAMLSGTSGQVGLWNGTSSLIGNASILWGTSNGPRISVGTTNTQGVLNLGGNKDLTSSGIQSYFATATYTDITTAASGTASAYSINYIAPPTIAAANTSVTFPSISTLAVDAPTAGTNATITNRYAITTGSNGHIYAGGNVEMTGALMAGGAQYGAVTTINSSTTISTSAYWIEVDATSGNLTITLPAASSVFTGSRGVTYWLARVDGSGNTVTVQRAGSDTIGLAGTSFSLNVTDEVKGVQCVANNKWRVF